MALPLPAPRRWVGTPVVKNFSESARLFISTQLLARLCPLYPTRQFLTGMVNPFSRLYTSFQKYRVRCWASVSNHCHFFIQHTIPTCSNRCTTPSKLGRSGSKQVSAITAISSPRAKVPDFSTGLAS